MTTSTTSNKYIDSPNVTKADKKLLIQTVNKYRDAQKNRKHWKMYIGIIGYWNTVYNMSTVIKTIVQLPKMRTENIRFVSYRPGNVSGYSTGDYLKEILDQAYVRTVKETIGRLPDAEKYKLITAPKDYLGPDLRFIFERSDLIIYLGRKKPINIYPVKISKPYIIYCINKDTLTITNADNSTKEVEYMNCDTPGLLVSKSPFIKLKELDLTGTYDMSKGKNPGSNVELDILRNYTSLANVIVEVPNKYSNRSPNPLIELLINLSNNMKLRKLEIRFVHISTLYTG